MPSETADVTVSLAAGLSVTGATMPSVTAWLLARFGTDAAALVAILGGATLVTGAAVGFSRVGGSVAVRVGGTPVGYLLTLVPLLPVLALPVWWPPIGVRNVLFVGAIFGFLATLLFVLVCQTRHANAVTPDDAVSWTAAPPERVARRRRRVGIALFLLGFVLLGLGILLPHRGVQYLGQWLVPVAAVTTASATRVGTFEVSDAGLTRRSPAHAVTRPWRRFRGYERVDDALVIHRAGPWRWLPAIRLAREDLEDEERVVAAIDRHLPATRDIAHRA